MTSDSQPEQRPEARASFSEQADLPQIGFWREFGEFLRHNKKWWLAPLLVILALMALLIFLSGSPLAPFIYPVF